MNEMFTGRQATLWFILYLIGNGFLLLPSVLAATAKQDVWLSVLLAIGFQMALVPMYIAISKQMQGKSMAVHLQTLFGRRVGGLAAIAFVLLVPYLNLVITLRHLDDFIQTTMMPETPSEAIYAFMFVAVYYAIRSGAAVIGRSVEILFFVIPLLYALVTFALVSKLDYNNLLPMLEYGWKPVIRGSFPIFAFPFMETVLFLFLKNRMKNPDLWKRSVVWSILISGAMYLIMFVNTTAVLGQEAMSNLTYASYFVVRTISIADFIERFEIAVTIFWYISIFYRLVLLMYITVHVTADVVRLQNPSALLVPLMVIALVMARSIWPDTSFLFEMFRIWPYYAACYGIASPLLLWLMGCFKSRVNRQSASVQASSD